MGNIVKFKLKPRQVGDKAVKSFNKASAVLDIEAPPGSGKMHHFKMIVPAGIKQDQYLDGVRHRLLGGTLGFTRDENGKSVKDLRQLKHSFREGFRAASFYIQAERKRQNPDAQLQAYKFRGTQDGLVKGIKQMDYVADDLNPGLRKNMLKGKPGPY